jgi:secreted trypsin-like serine protease
VVGGITNLQTQAGAVETEIASIIIHPEYDPFQELPPNDIALLELQTPLNVSAATLFAGESEAHAGELAWVAGWGATSYERDIPGNYPAALQDAAVPLVFNSECNSPQSYDGLITPTHLCAGFVDGEVDACAGDSGGPLFVIENDVPQQIGITSFGNGCGLPLFYGIYTNVSHFIPWLANYIEVPYQSPELVASRQEIVNVPVSVLPANTPASTPANTPGSSTGTQASATNSRSFTGASGSVWLCLIAMALGLRRRFINAYISSERI